MEIQGELQRVRDVGAAVHHGRQVEAEEGEGRIVFLERVSRGQVEMLVAQGGRQRAILDRG